MISNTIIEILNQVANTSENYTEDTKIIEEIGLDSIQMIKFILMVEEAFDFEMDFEEFEVDILESIKTFSDYVKQHIKEDE